VSLREGPYAAAWRRYQRWCWTFWLLFVLYLPALAILSRAMGWTRGSGTPIVVAAFAWTIAFGIVGYQTGNFRCPRCGELFFRKFDDRIWRRTWVQKPFARRCLHCGLPKWAGHDPGPHEIS
jgi:hypothetical protein